MSRFGMWLRLHCKKHSHQTLQSQTSTQGRAITQIIVAEYLHSQVDIDLDLFWGKK